MGFEARLKALIAESGLGRDDFAKKIGISRRSLFNYLGGKNPPTGAFYQSVKTAFPWVNVEWLITGQGEMVSRKEDFSTYQVATGNGNIQAGGSINGKVVGGVYADESRQGAGTVEVDQVIRVLADYLAPKAIEEIKKRLSEGA